MPHTELDTNALTTFFEALFNFGKELTTYAAEDGCDEIVVDLPVETFTDLSEAKRFAGAAAAKLPGLVVEAFVPQYQDHNMRFIIRRAASAHERLACIAGVMSECFEAGFSTMRNEASVAA